MFPPHAGGGAPPHNPMAPKPAGPVAGVFHNLAAHQMAPAMGHAPNPQMPGAPMQLGPTGHPPAPYGHMPTMTPR